MSKHGETLLLLGEEAPAININVVNASAYSLMILSPSNEKLDY
jgi:hypothetical protein